MPERTQCGLLAFPRHNEWPNVARTDMIQLAKLMRCHSQDPRQLRCCHTRNPKAATYPTSIKPSSLGQIQRPSSFEYICAVDGSSSPRRSCCGLLAISCCRFSTASKATSIDDETSLPGATYPNHLHLKVESFIASQDESEKRICLWRRFRLEGYSTDSLEPTRWQIQPKASSMFVTHFVMEIPRS